LCQGRGISDDPGEGRWKVLRHFLTASYSFHDVGGKNAVESFAVPNNPNVLLGFAPQKPTRRVARNLGEGRLRRDRRRVSAVSSAPM
jgi:hypothetical protein